MLVPSSLALIISNFEGPAQGKAIGTWTAWTGIAFVLGPLAGGALVDAGSWRAVFAINVVPVAATLLVLARTAPEARPAERTPVDFVGAALCAVGLGGLIFALIEQPARGWGAPSIYVPLVTGVVVLAGFVLYEGRAAHPMVDFALFRRRNFSVGNLATVAVYAGVTASTFLLTVFLQQVGRYSAMAAGLALLPVTLIMFALSPVFGRLAGRHGPRLYMSVGPLTAAVGFALMTGLDARARYVTQVLPGMIVFGLGLATTVAPLTTAILGDVDQRHAGIASAINNAVARVAGLLAVAAFGALVAARFGASIDRSVAAPNTPDAQTAAALVEAKRRPLETSIPAGVPPTDRGPFETAVEAASVDAMHAGLWAMAASLALGGIIAAIGIANPRRGAKP
jgi:EmrB/QacA subfamily drug resistance transporter